MHTCEVLIVGGGPAGSTCAWKLRKAGVDVTVMDTAVFPRDKVCAGWITPQVIDELQIDPAEYRDGRTLQPITGFRVGVIGGGETVEAAYRRTVSFGIRRCEFDHYLLRRCGARLLLGEPVSRIRRSGTSWLVNDAVKASMLVGAGGHFCPIGRLLNGRPDQAVLVAAQEAEFRIDSHGDSAFTVAAERPELYFSPDLAGYGWCLRKQDYVNVGFGRVGAHAVPRASAEFVAYLKARRTIPNAASWRWRGHAYLLAGASRRVVDAAVMLIGDSAGLACPQSGEGIRPAVESGLLAAATIVEASGRYTRDRLERYANYLHNRFDVRPLGGWLPGVVPGRVSHALALRLLDSPWFVRHVVLDRWFLHSREAALSLSGRAA